MAAALTVGSTSDAGVARRTDRAEQVDRLVAQVAHAARAQAALEPPATDAPGLADPRLTALRKYALT